MLHIEDRLLINTLVLEMIQKEQSSIAQIQYFIYNMCDINIRRLIR